MRPPNWHYSSLRHFAVEAASLAHPLRIYIENSSIDAQIGYAADIAAAGAVVYALTDKGIKG
jgi:hypothetical protein